MIWGNSHYILFFNKRMIVLILSYVEIFIKGGEKILRPRHAYFRYCSRVAQTATDFAD